MRCRHAAGMLAMMSLTAGMSQAADELALRQNVVNTLIAEPVDVAVVEKLIARVSADGAFDHVEYANTQLSGWKAHDHIRHLRLLAIAYTRPGTPLYRSPAVRDAIVSTYNHWVNRTPAYTSANWWYNEIGVPLFLSDAMLLMQHGGILPADNFAAGAGLLNKALPSQERMTAANLMWLAYSTRNEGILRYLQPDATDAQKEAAAALIRQSVLRIGSTFVLTSEDGIQADHSFHAHGPMLYDGGYGVSWVGNAGRVAAQSAGTAYAVSDEAARILIDYLLDGAQWMQRGDSIDLLTTGREISRAAANRKALTHLDPAIQGIAIGKGYRRAELEKLRDRIEKAKAARIADPGNVPVGNRQFRRSDYMVQQRPEGMFSVKTISTRTTPPESINGENLRGTYLYSGVNLIYRTGNEYEDLAPVWDWDRLPGTTSERGSALLPASGATGRRGKTAFVGGASDGMNGLTAYRQDYLNVSASKSWMMFDNVQVALGAAIAAPAAEAGHRVGTNLNQTRLEGAVTYSTAAGVSTTLEAGQTVTPEILRWVHHDSIGYFFFEPVANAAVSARTQRGAWWTINTSQPKATTERPVFSLDLDHGVAPRDAAYAYFIVAGIEAREMEAYLAKSPFTVLRNDADVQAVQDNLRPSLRPDLRQRIEATFYAPASLSAGDLTLIQTTPDQGSSLILNREGDTLTLSVASPAQWQGELTYRLTAHLVGDHANWNAEAGYTTLTFTLPTGDAAGSTVTRQFKVVPR